MGSKAVGCAVGGSTGAVLGGLVTGGLNAAWGAASGAVGSAVLAAGYVGYEVLEATQMGAVGNAILAVPLGTCVGGIAGGLIGCGLFGNNNKGSQDNKTKSGNGCVSAVMHVGLQTLGGVVGWAVMNAGDAETIMNLSQTAAALATGSAITLLPAACITTCIAIPLVLGGIACATSCFDNDKEADIDDDATVEAGNNSPMPV
jgi:hypothetical protein